MENLTVGYIEEQLREYPKDTVVEVGCNVCNHSSVGSKYILNIEDKTDQTFGYITISFNHVAEGKPELNPDKEEFYKKEVLKLKKQIEKKDKNIKLAERYMKYLKGELEGYENQKRLEDK